MYIGRGYLGYAIQLYYSSLIANVPTEDAERSPGVIPALVLIERSGCRKKADNRKTISGNSVGDGDHCYRYRIDIRHCSLPEVLKQVSSRTVIKADKDVIVVAKHLCGCATDMTLRSMSNLIRSSKENSVDSPRNIARGIAIATCCHHACNWNDYVGKSFLIAQGFSPEEFNVMRSWSGWASMSAANRADSEVKEHPSGSEARDNQSFEEISEHADTAHAPDKVLPTVIRPNNISKEQMLIVGCRVKCILDYGRCQYMKEMLGCTEAVYTEYCSSSLTPECRLLIGRV